MRDLMKSLPAMHDLAKQAGVKLPEYLGSVGVSSETDSNNSPEKPE